MRCRGKFLQLLIGGRWSVGANRGFWSGSSESLSLSPPSFAKRSLRSRLRMAGRVRRALPKRLSTVARSAKWTSASSESRPRQPANQKKPYAVLLLGAAGI
jgi:hypothetical protein